VGERLSKNLDARFSFRDTSELMRKNHLPLALALALVFTAGGASLVPCTAHADHQIGTPFTGNRPFQLDVHAGFLWSGYGFAAGARFGIPIMHNGFVSSIDNAVYLNFGFDFYYLDTFDGANRHYGAGFGIPVTLHWEFYFSDTWSAFAELGFQVFFHPRFFEGGGFYADAGHWVIGMVGGSLHFSEAVALTLRIGNPYAALGLTFQF
jgi:hypothetical protein